jgi:toxin-antitoxin system PIN domain toxin
VAAGLLDVNVLVALAWDSHVHHVAARGWFVDRSTGGWATCPVTETGFVRVSSNPKVLPAPIGIEAARTILSGLCGTGDHRFVVDDVSIRSADVPAMSGHRQVTDAHLLTLARRHGMSLVTFDRGLLALAAGDGVELLSV